MIFTTMHDTKMALFMKNKVKKMTEKIANILANAKIPSSTTFIPYRYSDDDKTTLEIITDAEKTTVTSSQSIKLFQLISTIPNALHLDGYSNDAMLNETALLSISMSESSKIIEFISAEENSLTVKEISALKKIIDIAVQNQADYITAFILLK
ncbi:hypothetical protein ACIPSD_06615 [Pectobacterium sp. CHL-2024]|uniref:hypothetical protein n=1 Tax=Pectobacterium TaxID=122277 RepID=UPI00207E719C|nr:hypothetical protein [Pectobacterium carotovorum]GKV90480.1 hypothetical protein PEC301619_24620 [Pectobacterium carotovorum subsp. carotovorum]